MDELTRLLEQQLAGENRIAQQITAFETAALDPLLAQQATSTASQGTADFLAGLVTPGSAPNIAAFSAGLETSAVAAKTSAQERVILAEQQRAAKVSAFERELAVAREERDATTALRAEGREIASSDQRLKLQRAQTQTATLRNAQTEATQEGVIAATNAQSQSTVDTAEALAGFKVSAAALAVDAGQVQVDNANLTNEQLVLQASEAVEAKAVVTRKEAEDKAVLTIAGDMGLLLNNLFLKNKKIPTQADIDKYILPAVTNFVTTDPSLKERPTSAVITAVLDQMQQFASVNKEYEDARLGVISPAQLRQDLLNQTKRQNGGLVPGGGGFGGNGTSDEFDKPNGN